MNFFSPAQIAENYIKTGISKVKLNVIKTLVLAILAGIFIALAGVGATTASVSIPEASVAKLVGALIFPTGLIMVLLAGSELFTGNNLLVIPLMQKEITVTELLRNWVIVYIGNFIGGLLVAIAVVYSDQIALFNNALAVSVITTAVQKCSLSFSGAFIKGILCNFLVCIAVWISFGAKDVAGKILGMYFPIMLFVLCGFEHSIANMYYIGAGLFAKLDPIYLKAALDAGANIENLTWMNFFIKNLIPVTLGNIIGGAVCVGLVYWYVYLREN